MGQILPGYPSRAQHTYTVTLGETSFRVRLTLNSRLESWFLDLYAADGTPLALGRRVVPGGTPITGLVREGMPNGHLVVRSPDAAAPDDLGTDLVVVFYPTSELTATADDRRYVVTS